MDSLGLVLLLLLLLLVLLLLMLVLVLVLVFPPLPVTMARTGPLLLLLDGRPFTRVGPLLLSIMLPLLLLELLVVASF